MMVKHKLIDFTSWPVPYKDWVIAFNKSVIGLCWFNLMKQKIVLGAKEEILNNLFSDAANIRHHKPGQKCKSRTYLFLH